ncbi:hypothetical protein JXB12_09315 [candidate division KSB1 bacterium]|nr:hypothetical protein [candidate division KSB1 bacterium]
MIRGKALDIMESNPHCKVDSHFIGTSNYDDIVDPDVVIVTAGLHRKPGVSREYFPYINLDAISAVATPVKENALNAFCIILTNPRYTKIIAIFFL